MTLFQTISISILLALLAYEVFRFGSRAGHKPSRWIRAAVWLLAALAIARPDFVQHLAESVGIHRGADLVFYLFVLTFLGVTFYFYSRFVRLQRQVTQLVRHISLREATRGGEGSIQ